MFQPPVVTRKVLFYRYIKPAGLTSNGHIDESNFVHAAKDQESAIFEAPARVANMNISFVGISWRFRATKRFSIIEYVADAVLAQEKGMRIWM